MYAVKLSVKKKALRECNVCPSVVLFDRFYLIRQKEAFPKLYSKNTGFTYVDLKNPFKLLKRLFHVGHQSWPLFCKQPSWRLNNLQGRYTIFFGIKSQFSRTTPTWRREAWCVIPWLCDCQVTTHAFSLISVNDRLRATQTCSY